MTEKNHETVSSSIAVHTRDTHHNDNGTATVSTDSPKRLANKLRINIYNLCSACQLLQTSPILKYSKV